MIDQTIPHALIAKAGRENLARVGRVPPHLIDRWTATHEKLLPVMMDGLCPAKIVYRAALVEVHPVRSDYALSDGTTYGKRKFVVTARRTGRVSRTITFDKFKKHCPFVLLRSGSGKVYVKATNRATHKERIKGWRNPENFMYVEVQPNGLFAEQADYVADQIVMMFFVLGVE